MALNVSHQAKITTGELGNLFLTFQANSMSERMLTYLANCTVDTDIKKVVEDALKLSIDIRKRTEDILKQENVPVPVGFTEQDVVPNAPKLWSDNFHINYLALMGNLAPIFYTVGLPSIARLDIQKFYMDILSKTVLLHNEIDTVMLEKGIYIRPPYVPIPPSSEYVHTQNYIKKTRPLNAIEIAQIHQGIQFNAIKTGMLTGFKQVTKMKDIRKYFDRGIHYNFKQASMLNQVLNNDEIGFTATAGQDVLDSTEAPFSDKLMLFHITQLSSAKARNFGDAIAVCARHDLGLLMMRLMTETAVFAEDGLNLLIEHEWLEQIPQAPDRNQLANNRK